ncbi:hypothetical protein O181_102897 [Austropuccinia psidii MF-1]|uniref:Uncharacterized protein n=1 Tax=Austropuccinia psidii MF-1 TaxID=1389203 RepID=A0A9Q3PJX8_9BASI|nr:hypothetical protein [Austropuccinia psidii MF-1]
MVRQENIETASTSTRIIPASIVIVTQSNQPEPISSELINFDISNTLQNAKNLANIQEPAITPQAAPRKVIDVIMAEGQESVDDLQINNLCHSEADNTALPSNRDETVTRSLSGHLQSQPEGLQQCTAAQRVPDPFRPVEKLHEFLPHCEKILGPSQHMKVTQWMASIYGKEEHDALNSRMEDKQPSPTQTSAKNSPSGQKEQFQREKAATSSEQGQRKGTSHKPLQPGLQDAMENVFQMARTMMELQKKEEARLKDQK